MGGKCVFAAAANQRGPNSGSGPSRNAHTNHAKVAPTNLSRAQKLQKKAPRLAPVLFQDFS